GRVAILEAQHARLVQRAVEDLEMRLDLADMIERHVPGFGDLVDQHRMALRERAAAGILARQSYWRAFRQEGAPGERFAGRPVDVVAGFDGLALLLELARNLAVEIEVLGYFGNGPADGEELLDPDRGRGRAILFAGRRRH